MLRLLAEQGGDAVTTEQQHPEMGAMTKGAVTYEQCPNGGGIRAFYRRYPGCGCGKCALCGYPKHTAIHGPALGAGPGSQPWGHEFVGER